MLLAAVGIGFIGCEKEEEKLKEDERSVVETDVLNKLMSFNKEYANSNLFTKADGSSLAQQATVDALAMVAGGRWGTAIAGFPWGTLVGALVGGGAASYFANEYSDPNNLLYAEVMNYEVSILANPNNNPFDSIGYEHNLMLKDLIINYGSNDNLASSKDIVGSFDGSTLETQLAASLPINELELFYSEKDIEQVSNAVRNMATNVSLVTDIMEDYFLSASSLNSFDNFLDHNYAFESQVIKLSDEEIGEEDKAMLLMSLSVARYSNQMWLTILNN